MTVARNGEKKRVRNLEALRAEFPHEKCAECQCCAVCGRFHPCKRSSERKIYCKRHGKGN